MSFSTQQKYPVCDTYFVEDIDAVDGIYAAARAERDRKYAYDRSRQRQMAQDMTHLAAKDYESDILRHMESMELETLPDINSIEVQTEIQWYMRPYLLDFLLEAHQAFQLLPETLFLSVNILDRYCSKRVVYKRHYQLVGCAALLIAAKYGDRKERVPTIRELKSMCCSLYDEDMFTQMEWHVLQTINWLVGHPTVSSFLDLALYESPQDPTVEHMALYLSELALYHKELIAVKPSVMARSSLALAKYILNISASRTGEWCSLYDAQVVLDLSNHLSHPSQGLHRKYADASFSCVSEILDHFMQGQARANARASTSRPHTAGGSASAQQHEEFYMHPQTPQKLSTNLVAQDSLLTPPITPPGAWVCPCPDDMCSLPSYHHAHRAGPTPPTSGHSNQTFPLGHCQSYAAYGQ